ncbi:MAG: MucB/RseB C-terminal domain-containing protein [Porticoccaceae bacterium]|nr:MucB/RseB C-terminal domain-containing protein [Porticoccaceae bacterium]
MNKQSWLISFNFVSMLCAMLFSHFAVSQQFKSADELLAEMTNSADKLNYSGLVTYEKSGRLKSLKVLHLARDGISYEKIVHVDGPKGEFAQLRHRSACKTGNAMISEKDLPSLNEDSLKRFAGSYSFEIRGKSRVASRIGTLLFIKPNDQFRLPYILTIDQQTNLILKSVILDLSGKPLERFQFVEIAIGGNLDLLELPTPAAPDNRNGNCNRGFIEKEQRQWVVNWMPPGFVMTASEKNEASDHTTMVFSDGLASFSVFVISDTKGSGLPSFTSSSGATTVVSVKLNLDGAPITVSVVGEIPQSTARKIAQSILRSSEITETT